MTLEVATLEEKKVDLRCIVDQEDQEVLLIDMEEMIAPQFVVETCPLMMEVARLDRYEEKLFAITHHQHAAVAVAV